MKKLYISLVVVILSSTVIFAGDWKLSSFIDPINDVQTAVFSLENDSQNSSENMILEIHHKVNSNIDPDPNKDALLIGINEKTLNNESNITIRFDKETAYTEGWIVNGEANCLVSPNVNYMISNISRYRS